MHALAVGLMLVQVAAGPLHASPVAAPARASAADSTVDLLEICTARGLVRLVAGEIPSDQPDPADRSVPSCPVCTAMGAAHAIGLPEGPVMPVMLEWAIATASSAYREVRTGAVVTVNPPRAPPAVV